jgi:hypothetical protein
VADPGRELAVEGDLDAVIAGGLGFDLDAVRKIGQQVGILAAVTQAQVPIANREGQLPLDQRAIAGLRDALSAELDKVLRVAAPTAGRRGARAADVPDALDELIARAAEREDAEE